MNWLIRTLAGAMIAGVGWKFGADAYEILKKQLRNQSQDPDQSEDNGAGATQTEVVDVTEKDS